MSKAKTKRPKSSSSPRHFSPGTRVVLKSDGRQGEVIFPGWISMSHPIHIRLDDGGTKQCSESELVIEDYVAKTGGAYLDQLQPIYRDVLNAFWTFNPNARPDWGVTAQSLASALSDKYTVGQIREACEQFVSGNAMTVEDGIFYRLTPLGDAILYNLQQRNEARATVPPFSPPPGL